MRLLRLRLHHRHHRHRRTYEPVPLSRTTGSVLVSIVGVGAVAVGVHTMLEPATADPAVPAAPPVTASATPAPSVSPARALPRKAWLPYSGTGRVIRGITAATVCTSGYATSIRPPSSYTDPLKRAQVTLGGTFTYQGQPARGYAYPDHVLAHYEEDHVIPLSLGGQPRDPMNLYPEPLHATAADGGDAGAYTKDRYEGWVWRQVCSGALALHAAQARFRGDWYAHAEADGEVAP